MKRLFLTAVLYATFAAVFAFGQTSDQAPATGVPPFGSFQGGPDVVDLSNLNVHFSVPIIRKKGRGLNFSYALGYDNSVWSLASTASGSFWTHAPNWGWGAGASGLGTLQSGTTLVDCNGTTSSEVTFSGYLAPDGTSHPFGTLMETGGCSGGQITGTTSDGSGFTVVVNGTTSASVTGIDGSTVAFGASGQSISTVPSSLTDANGNQLSFSGLLVSLSNGGANVPANGIVASADTLGSAPFSISGQPPNTVSYEFANPTGGTSTITLSFKSYSFASNFQCSGVGDVGSSSGNTASFPDTITLPNGLTYHFTYETLPNSSAINGRIASIILPTGGTISYQYAGSNDGINCSDGTTLSLTRTTPDGKWTYTRSVSGSSSTTTVTDPLGNQTVYTFSGLYQTQKQVYQGSAASGTLLRTITTCYNTTSSNCATAAVSLPITKKTVTIVLENKQQRTITTTFTPAGQVLERDESDFGSGSSGPVLRKTVTAYSSLGNSISKPSTVTISDGNGNQFAQTTFAYDGNSLTTTSGLPQHVAVSGARGNVNSVQRFLQVPGQSSSTVSNTFSYDDTGRLLSRTDGNGNTTTYAYQCSDSYLQMTTLPTTSSVAHSTTVAVDCNTGTTSSSTDQNGQETQYAYDDMFRVTQVTLPAQVVNGSAMNGQITTAYTDNVGSLSAQQITLQNSSASVATAQFFDSLGRQNETEITDPEGNIFTQTVFDALGRQSSVSNPFRKSTDTTYGFTSNSYDALGRVTQVTKPDGSTRLYTYSGNAWQVQDEGNGNGNSRITRIYQKDGLGRLTAVCEVISATAASGDKPSSCGLQIAGTGFLTTYMYDPLGNLTEVQQGPGPLVRSFTYDSLSRLISAINPESGTTSYTYDANGNILTRVRPLQGQANPLTTVTTTYTYDDLNRVTAISYSDGVTPSVSKHYDTTVEMGIGLDNTVGRLSAEYVTNSSGQLVAGKAFSYDPLGRLIGNPQCISSSSSACSGSNPSPLSITYTYDLIGDQLSQTDGAGHTFSYTYDSVGRLSTMTSSLTGTNYPPTLLSSPSYSPLGLLTGASIGGVINEAYAYDCRNRIVAYGSALSPGTPSLTSVTDPGCPNATAEDRIDESGSELAETHLLPEFNPFDPGMRNLVERRRNPIFPAMVASRQSGKLVAGHSASLLLARANKRLSHEHGSVAVTLMPQGNLLTQETVKVAYGQKDTAFSIARKLARRISGSSGSRLLAEASSRGRGALLKIASRDLHGPGFFLSASVSGDRGPSSITLSTADSDARTTNVQSRVQIRSEVRQ